MATRSSLQQTACRYSRRQWIAATAGAGAFWIVPRHTVAGGRKRPPSERLNIAGVGLGAMGLDNLQHCQTENVVAVCDVDWRLSRYALQQFAHARHFKDYRKMLDTCSDIDAVVIATPDHTHAAITAAAMQRGKHVYTQMPLAHDVRQVRRLSQLARQTGVVTQMGNDRHSGPDVRRVCEWVWSGQLGNVRDVHCWTNRPQWPQGMRRPADRPALPPDLDWSLWLGGVAKRPYHPAYHPYNWRGWRAFGTGALGAIGCHLLDAPVWSLHLDEADQVRVTADCRDLTDDAWPTASTVKYEFPQRGSMPQLTLTWYDGGRQPPRPPQWPAARRSLGSNGTLFVGEEHTLVFGATTAGTHPSQAGPRLLPERLMADDSPKKTLPRVDAGDAKTRHEQEWIAACKQGGQPSSNFASAGPLTELVLLGNVAIAAGHPIVWDRDRCEITNDAAADALLGS